MNVKKLRDSKKMSQAALARASGMAQSSISYIESGKKNPSMNTAIKLSKALGITLEELVNS